MKTAMSNLADEKNKHVNMHIKKIDIRNFRLLKEITLSLDKQSTVIVGRNNSGKTSLAELFRRLLSGNSVMFNLEDFSLGVHEQFWTAFVLKHKGGEDDDVRKELPIIETQLTLSYAPDNTGLLSDFIVDLNPDCTDALIDIRYELGEGKIKSLFDGIGVDDVSPKSKQKTIFFNAIKERIPKYYKINLFAVDPNDPTNRKSLDWQKLRLLLQGGFINAQRGLDDTTSKDNDVLGKIVGVLFSTAMSESADEKDRTIAEKLEGAVQGIQEGIDRNFNEQLKGLLPAFKLFGYPGLRDPELRTHTMLDVGRLLDNHTKIRYSGINGVHLPETYNGLGTRNLIFILLKLLEFFKSWKTMQPMPGVHLVFIEEPEAHLHPQMQEVFINKLSDIAGVFAHEFNNDQPWPVQFIVTTHSSHVANKASFKTMRYFLATESGATSTPMTKIKDLSHGISNTFPEDEAFLHQYMTLTRCDLFFADKAVLIEGTTERLLLPKMIEKVDVAQPIDQKLASQYLSIMEVGGAYAHKFFKLLDFLELPALIITDMDSAKKNKSQKLIACKVSEATCTSNACIKKWFDNPDIAPADLIKKTSQEKTKTICHLAYQIPEVTDGPCGRSFEDTFMLANLDMFDLKGTSDEKADSAWDKAKDEKKSEFALKYAIEKSDWVVPRYIKEGLAWLAKNPAKSVADKPGKTQSAEAVIVS